MDILVTERQNKMYAFISTILMLLLLALIIFFIRFITPIPPFEESNGPPGFEVNFGTADAGMGTDFSHENMQVKPKLNPDDIKQNNEHPSPDNDMITQDDPSNVHVKSDPKQHPEKDTPKEQQPDKNLQNAFNNFNDSKQGSDGDKNAAGNQGNPNGGDSKNYTGDNANGTGGDCPTCPPKGSGHGITYNLKNRKITAKPPLITDFSEDGVIVVDIIVNNNGKVVQAEVNRAKSKNPNYYLCSYARQQAMQTIFSPSGDMEQKGTITFEYIHK